MLGLGVIHGNGIHEVDILPHAFRPPDVFRRADVIAEHHIIFVQMRSNEPLCPLVVVVIHLQGFCIEQETQGLPITPPLGNMEAEYITHGGQMLLGYIPFLALCQVKDIHPIPLQQELQLLDGTDLVATYDGEQGAGRDKQDFCIVYYGYLVC